MAYKGGCYCGALRYEAEGAPVMQAQCHCRECQYITGGAPNLFMLMPRDGFTYVQGEPKSFTRSDLDAPVTRQFCATCGTHVATQRPGLPFIVLKIGTLDDPAQFEGPKLAIYTIDKQSFHAIPDDLPAFERMPAR